MAKSIASGFTISGLLDKNTSTRNDYPVERIPVSVIADHPANAAYSMDDAGIAQLARSIEEEGPHRPAARPQARRRGLADGERTPPQGGLRPACRRRRALRADSLPRHPGHNRRAVGPAAARRQLLRAQPHRIRARSRKPRTRRGGRAHARREPRAFRRAHGGHQGGDHFGADRAQGVRQDHPAPGGPLPARSRSNSFPNGARQHCPTLCRQTP